MQTITAGELGAEHHGQTVRIDGEQFGLIASQGNKHGVLLAVQDSTGRHRPKRVTPDALVEVLG